MPSFQLVSPSAIFFFSYWNLIWLVFIKVKHFWHWFRIFLHINYTLTAAVIICFQSFWIFFFIQQFVFKNFKQKMNIFYSFCLHCQDSNISGIMLKRNLWILDFLKKKFHFFHNWISEKVISSCTKFTGTKNDNLIKMSTNS